MSLLDNFSVNTVFLNISQKRPLFILSLTFRLDFVHGRKPQLSSFVKTNTGSTCFMHFVLKEV